ncbi:related to geranylgeranyltransferase type I alpha subunit (RAM2) [Cephalotrichum gorgonifer]|uniref:Protein farnesyltransferase/geranylgeranyltransferase type-1 subunit alpha n=1 Tax=Cephalotrichum gorgonifer TaxID=2041049 RepID=A0AAE8MSM4_9PEZI|nr:related to geranylgeranyltransferase type I alpha subunit (RAM2) [Cephalotrichum gorgonifer]
MPPKPKSTGPKAKQPDSKADEAKQNIGPLTINELSQQRYYLTNPVAKRAEEVGLSSLTPAERQSWANAQLLPRVSNRKTVLPAKVEREYWKQVAKENVPIRALSRDYDWGRDKFGREIGGYLPEQFDVRRRKESRLAVLRVEHERFLTRRDLKARGVRARGGRTYEVTEEDVQAEKKRREEMAGLKMELYGERSGPYANDPEWDDVVPIPAQEPEGALAAIAYPDDYSEAMSYLRAVMAAEEHSPRCLRLTENIISMNPAHYTVWLYRFKIISALDLPVPDEITWLNEVALTYLKNYQIWHHRQLLIDLYYPKIASDAEQVSQLARSETKFISSMLEEDTKNYHVWSYRQYLVRKLSLFTLPELLSTQNLIEDDVRNNSAWSHRFLVVFSDPKASTEGSLPTEHDPKIPQDVLDREVNYAKEKILLAPQNQAAWNYLRGVLTKGGRKMGEVREFAEGFVDELGGEEEEVRSSHALDCLAEAYLEEGNKERARLCLRRLAEKWDPVRAGYWSYREQLAEA